MQKLFALLLVACVLVTGPKTAFAQTYPTKPVKIIAGFPPGEIRRTISGYASGEYQGMAVGERFIQDSFAPWGWIALVS